MGCGCFCKVEDLGRKQPELPWYLHETISFHLGLNSGDLEIRWGIGEEGVDFEGCKSAGFSRLVFFFSLPPPNCLFLSLSPFVGNKHISKDELYPPHWRTCFAFWMTEQLQRCVLCKCGWWVCVCLTCVFLLSRFCWQVNIWIDFPKVSERLTHRLCSWHLILEAFDKSEEVGLYWFLQVSQ